MEWLGVGISAVWIVVLWVVYTRTSKKSYVMGIQDDPFRLPCFILCCIATFGLVLVIINLLFEMVGFSR